MLWLLVTNHCPLTTDHCPLTTDHCPLTTLNTPKRLQRYCFFFKYASFSLFLEQCAYEVH